MNIPKKIKWKFNIYNLYIWKIVRFSRDVNNFCDSEERIKKGQILDKEYEILDVISWGRITVKDLDNWEIFENDLAKYYRN